METKEYLRAKMGKFFFYLHRVKKLASNLANVKSGDHAATWTTTQITTPVVAERSLCAICAQQSELVSVTV